MVCQYYKSCYAYEADKPACENGFDCRVYDELFNAQEKRSAVVPTHNPNRITAQAGLEILAIDDSIKQKRKNVSTKK
jgi:hypothetical protein